MRDLSQIDWALDRAQELVAMGVDNPRGRTFAGEVIETLAAEVKALRAIIEGSTVRPTAEEHRAHTATGGEWRCVVVAGLYEGGVTRWWPLDDVGRPVARPVVTT